MEVVGWEVVSTKTELITPIFTIEKSDTRSCDNLRKTSVYRVVAPDWVNVIAVTADKKVLMITQFRHGIQQLTQEIPGGMVDPGETAMEAAKRELLEETGYVSDRWELCGVVASNPAFMTNRMHTFVAWDVHRMAGQSLDENEQIDVQLVALDDVAGMLRSGAISHALVVGAFLHFGLRFGWSVLGDGIGNG